MYCSFVEKSYFLPAAADTDRAEIAQYFAEGLDRKSFNGLAKGVRTSTFLVACRLAKPSTIVMSV